MSETGETATRTTNVFMYEQCSSRSSITFVNLCEKKCTTKLIEKKKINDHPVFIFRLRLFTVQLLGKLFVVHKYLAIFFAIKSHVSRRPIIAFPERCVRGNKCADSEN